MMDSIAEQLITDIEQARSSLTRLTTVYDSYQQDRDYSALDMDFMMLVKDLEMAMRTARKILCTIEGTVPRG